ncbi:hypothetical protein PVAG01_00419 [Phlyctema vagabunda]|uniref:Uncharacterized protein n=1 Tax=Phlyctema vagabunda TaxID=108571 RepID=A0ABR4PUG1_9HELO
MRLVRQLPPQFLIPSWSVRQLPPQFLIPSRSVRQRSTRGRRGSLETERAKSEGAPLYEELFPELAKKKQEPPPGPDFGGPKHVDRLPVFEWSGNTAPGQLRIKRAQRKDKRTGRPQKISWKDPEPEKEHAGKDEPSQEPPPRPLSWGNLSAIPPRRSQRKGNTATGAAITPHQVQRFEAPKVEGPREVEQKDPEPDATQNRHIASIQDRPVPSQDDLTPEIKARLKSTIVLLYRASSSLEESDFLRIGAKGEHIEGWARDILKVIPGYDPETYRRQSHYYILFNNKDNAHEYAHEIKRLHALARRDVLKQNVPISPSFLQEEEDLRTAASGYTLTSRAIESARTKVLRPPHSPSLQKVLIDAGPALLRTRPYESDGDVLFSISCGVQRANNLLWLFYRSGRARNLRWQFAYNTEETEWMSFSKLGRGDTEKGWVISFKNRQEARRFVREWHYRKVKDPDCGIMEESTTTAQLLW